MAGYVRPRLPDQVFFNADGQPFRYGNRWGFGSPPDDAYNVESHPERFAPLHDVADALVAYLEATYAVRVEHDVTLDDAPTYARGIVRTVRLTPKAPDAPPLTIIYTGYPGIDVRAGAFSGELLPVCGCDACDDSLEEQTDKLERLVLAVAEGRFAESLDDAGRMLLPTPTGNDLWGAPDMRDGVVLSTTVQGTDGSGYGPGGAVVPQDDPRLPGYRAQLAALPNGWQSWPRLSV